MALRHKLQNGESMATYLLTWNPARSGQWEDLEECVREIEERGYFEGSWSCGVTKKICPDDRVFLIKLGAEPRGIVASGQAVSYAYEDEHWDEQAAAKGKKALYIDVRFDTLLDPDKRIFPRARLSKGIYTKMHWEPQASGATIPDDVAERLEADWARFLKRPVPFKEIVFPEEAEVARTYTEGAKRQITVNAYERSREARQICIQRYGLNCSVCGFNFEETYGRTGKGYIHVHHLKPLSEIGKDYELNPITDLRPICPNCHAMIHQRNPAYKIDELKRILRRRKRST
jgi:5-methylcytosine-specific restriction protein A